MAPKIISVKQPWATLLALGIKTVENRTQRSHYTGRILIHASLKSDAKNPRVIDYCAARNVEVKNLELPTGGVIGIANLVKCFDAAESVKLAESHPAFKTDLRWYEGNFGYYMTDAQWMEFIPWKGALGIRTAPADLMENINRSYLERV